MSIFFTIGYEGATIRDFLSTLLIAQVQVLIDVRDVPLSRKPGFSKKVLAEALTGVGIEYLHLRGLGDPKLGREAARRGDMTTFKKIFCAHMETKGAQEALTEALEVALQKRACLFCFERDHTGCHRNIVAEKMMCREDLQVRHLGVRQGLSNKAANYAGGDNGAVFAFG